MDNKIKQLRKGILELAILGNLSLKSHYGYSLIKAISGESEIDLTEGTIYPILNRLSKEELVKSEWVESRQGPPRKYYSLTPKGEKAFAILSAEFTKLADMVVNASRKPAAQDMEESRKKISVKKEKDDVE